MHGWFYGYGGSWLWWLGPLFMVFFWGLVIAGIVLFIKRLTRFPRSGESPSEDSALEARSTGKSSRRRRKFFLAMKT